MSKIIVCDLEANGLDDATKVWCICMNELGTDKWYEVTGDEMARKYSKAIRQDYSYVWHNGLGYDLPLLLALHNIHYTTSPDSISGIPVQLIDTLALSRELWPDRPNGHGLKAWAKRLGCYKPEIKDWHTLPIEVYLERCREDVKTTCKVLEALTKEAEIEL